MAIKEDRAVSSNLFPFWPGFIWIMSMECSQEFWCVQVESENPLILITGIRPAKPLNIVTKRATAVTPVNLGVEDSCKSEMFITINDFDGTRQRLFAAWELVQKMQFKRRDVENGMNAREGLRKLDPIGRARRLLDDFVRTKMCLGKLFRRSCHSDELG
jgi:hypothetical protein